MSGHRPFKTLTDKMSSQSKDRIAALTRDANEAIKARAERDPEFRAALVEEADECDRSGDNETAQTLRGYLPRQEDSL
jgi:DNA-binding ferritin-like protein